MKRQYAEIILKRLRQGHTPRAILSEVPVRNSANIKKLDEALRPEETQIDCRRCGGRGFIVVPDIRNNCSVNWAMPCPECNQDAA